MFGEVFKCGLCVKQDCFVVVFLVGVVVDDIILPFFRCLLEHGRKGKVSKERFGRALVLLLHEKRGLEEVWKSTGSLIA